MHLRRQSAPDSVPMADQIAIHKDDVVKESQSCSVHAPSHCWEPSGAQKLKIDNLLEIHLNEFATLLASLSPNPRKSLCDEVGFRSSRSTWRSGANVGLYWPRITSSPTRRRRVHSARAAELSWLPELHALNFKCSAARCQNRWWSACWMLLAKYSNAIQWERESRLSQTESRAFW